MLRANINDLLAFLTVARQGSFTRAAAKLGVSPSALSHTIRNLETRLGLRLLNRTTRSVAPTEAGERLLQTLGPQFDAIEEGLESLSALRDRPAGTIRISTGEHAADTILWPVIQRLLPDYPDIKVELVIDNSLSDIVANHCDAGVRLGEYLNQDMIAVPVSPEMQMAVVAAPAYFTGRAHPLIPQDLVHHQCINMRLPTYGGLYAWEFDRDGREFKVRVGGQLILNSSRSILTAALSGLGLAYIPADTAASYVARGELIHVLADWCGRFPGYYLYYTSRHQPTPAFSVLLEALHYRG